MPRFYFHVNAGDELIPDDEGDDLPTIEAARRQAFVSARELLAGAIKGGKVEFPEAVVIADEAGHILEIVPLVAVLPEQFKRQCLTSCSSSDQSRSGAWSTFARRTLPG